MFYGITDKKVEELVGKLNFKNQRKKLLEPDIFEKLPESTKIDLVYKPIKKIPRAIINKIGELLPEKMIIAGSYRRGLPFSRDIDIVSVLPFTEFKLDTIEPFIKGEIITRTLLKFENKFYKIDYFYCSDEEFPGYLLYATGSKDFNIIMRQRAKKRGFLLNQRGLIKNGKLIKVKNEAEIFGLLGMKYAAPEDRDRHQKLKLNLNNNV